jgi:heme exporter protein B
MNAFSAILARDISLAFRAGGGGAQTALYFVLVAVLFAFAIGPDRAALSELASPVIWATALLAAMLSLDRIFQADYEDGTLDIIVATSDMLTTRVAAKIAAHWLSCAAPLLAAAPLVALLLNLSAERLGPLLLSLLVGTPALSCIGAVSAALTLPLRRAGVLVAILSAPLYAPTLIFGVAAASASEPSSPALLLLGANALLAAAIAPIAAAAAIRFNLS